MKTSFFGYYPPTDAEYQRLWLEGLIVLDTNVLLNLYRLPTTARDELFAVLDLLKDRLWIPHHVALEFQRRRLGVIAAERKSTEGALQSASELVAELKSKVDTLQIDKRGLGVASQPLIEDLEKANSKLIEAIASAHKAQLDISASDPVRERLDSLLEGRIGEGPSSQKDLDELTAEGDDRFKERIPPGFADADKERNPNEATFIHDRIKYQRKFGDLILWRQLIRHVKGSGIKSVLLVTADRKEDWWWREQGKIIGPHPELVREIVREGSVDLYWMYSSVQFVEHANKYSSARVSLQSVDELKQVALAPQARFDGGNDYPSIDVSSSPRPDSLVLPYSHKNRLHLRTVEESVERWLLQTQDQLERNRHEFPGWISTYDGSVHGFDIKFVRNFEKLLFSPLVINSLLRGYLETREERLSEFTTIIVTTAEEIFAIVESGRTSQLRRRLSDLLDKYPVSGIVVGAVLDDQFEPILHQQRRGTVADS